MIINEHTKFEVTVLDMEEKMGWLGFGIFGGAEACLRVAKRTGTKGDQWDARLIGATWIVTPSFGRKGAVRDYKTPEQIKEMRASLA